MYCDGDAWVRRRVPCCMCGRWYVGFLLLLVPEALMQRAGPPGRLRDGLDSLNSTFLTRLNPKLEVGHARQSQRGGNGEASHSSPPFGEVVRVPERGALGSGLPGRRPSKTEATEAQSQWQAPDVEAPRNGALETTNPKRKRWKKLQEVLWRILKERIRRVQRRRITKRAVCGGSYNVTRDQIYRLKLRSHKSCNFIFRAAPRAAFKLVCSSVSVANCNQAEIHLYSSTSTQRFCGETIGVSFNQTLLTDLLVSYELVGDAISLPRIVAKCKIVGTKGDGYKAEGQQPCPRSCGITRADAEASPPPNLVIPTPGKVNTSEVDNFVSEPKDPAVPQRIQGGKDASIGEWPWMLYVKLKVNGSPLNCGGTILTPLYVMTAAHCVYDVLKEKGDWVKVVANEYDWKDPNETASQVRVVQRIFVHPRYNSKTEEADIAVLLLKERLVIGKGVAPVCLASPATYDGSPVVLLGWGTLSYNGKDPRVLQESTQKVANLKECVSNYSSLAVNSNRFPITTDHVCTEALGIDTCAGDSGGPILVRRGTTWYQLGIVSFGYRCAIPGYPGVNTLVPSYISWVLSIVKDSSSCS